MFSYHGQDSKSNLGVYFALDRFGETMQSEFGKMLV